MPAAAALLLLAAPLLAPQEADQSAPKGRATVYRVDLIETLDGDPIKNGFVIVRDGLIEKIGQALVLPEGARVRDLRGSGSTITPPLALSHANFLVRSSRGGGLNGRFRAVDSLWLEPEQLHELLELGVLVAGVDPPGDGVPGRSSVISTDGGTPAPEPLVEDLHLSFQMMGSTRSAKDLLRKAIADAEKAIEGEDKAREAWQKARKEWEEKQKAKAEEAKKSAEGGKDGAGGGKAAQDPPKPAEKGKDDGKKPEEQEPPKEFEAPKIDPNLMPVVEWLRKERVVQVSFDKPAAWLHWLDLLGDRDLAWEAVLALPRWGGFAGNFHEVKDSIAAAGVRVYLPASLPDLPYTRIASHPAAELHAAGVEIVLTPPRADLEGVRSLRLGLADLVREGLDRRTAIEAVTLRPAAAMGQEELVQALKPGAPATFILLDGDFLNPVAEVQLVLRDGKVLYDRAKEEEDK
ncbi:MAG: hypothetical protein H8E31_10850 [Planctomycetes bacterium]|nr:hypothetical protein [Planctomycetota bacterium]